MSHKTNSTSPEITIRAAGDADLAALARLAGRDSDRVPAGPLLIAAVGPEVRAAISLVDGAVVADPFHRTVELVEMLRIRAAGATAGSRGTVIRFERPRRRRIAFRSAA
jgi:hypothetical protein